MAKLTMMKGLPGCGKSSWARAQVLGTDGQTKRVSMDDLRDMIDAGQWSKKNEKNVLAVRDLLIEYLLQSGCNVIVDATNLDPKHETRLREIAKDLGATFAVQDFTDVDVETCIKRDRERDRTVGEHVIKRMWKQYLYTPPPEVVAPERVEGLPSAIVVDLDGTVARMVTRGPHDYDKCGEDEPKQAVIDLVHMWIRERLQYGGDWHLIFCSGRPDSCRSESETWIRTHVLGAMGILAREWTLHMRPTWLEARRDSDKPVKDHRNDAIVKKEIYDKFIRGRYNVDFVLDDRNRVVDMWREQGLLCLQVAPGDF